MQQPASSPPQQLPRMTRRSPPLRVHNRPRFESKAGSRPHPAGLSASMCMCAFPFCLRVQNCAPEHSLRFKKMHRHAFFGLGVLWHPICFAVSLWLQCVPSHAHPGLSRPCPRRPSAHIIHTAQFCGVYPHSGRGWYHLECAHAHSAPKGVLSHFHSDGQICDSATAKPHSRLSEYLPRQPFFSLLEVCRRQHLPPELPAPSTSSQ